MHSKPILYEEQNILMEEEISFPYNVLIHFINLQESNATSLNLNRKVEASLAYLSREYAGTLTSLLLRHISKPRAVHVT